MSQIEVQETPFQGLKVLKRTKAVDERGEFLKIFSSTALADIGHDFVVKQINQSRTIRRGTVRGLHFQVPPVCDAKIVTCTHGEIFDIALDLRENSGTFGHHFYILLNGSDQTGLYIPKGFAHGFQSLKDDCTVLYAHDQVYAPNLSSGIDPLDPELCIDWPTEVTLMSPADREAQKFNEFGTETFNYEM